MSDNNKIPKIIHQIWIQGYDNISQENIKKIEKTKKIHPYWKYILWDENSIIKLLNEPENIKYKDKFYQFIYMHQKIDFAKIMILNKYGGIYIDMDCDVIKKLDSLFEENNNYDFIISKISNKIDGVSNYLTCHKFKECYNNGIIISKQNVEICEYLMDNFLSQCNYYENKLLCIQNTTGPPIFNKLIDKYISKNTNRHKILILPYYYFEPCVGSKCDINDNTHIVHKHELSWLSEWQKEIFEYITLNINLTYLIIILLIIIIFYSIKQ